MNSTRFFGTSLGWLVIFNTLGASELATFLNKEIFKNKTNGVFVDIGAYDGVTASNTAFFEKSLGWTGVCVEPLSTVYKKLTQNRSCVCVAGAIAATSGRREFAQVYGPNQLERLSGFVNTFYRENWEKINRQDMHGAGFRYIMVPTYTIQELCKKYGLTHIDYLSISTSGSEEEIIKSIDFSTIAISVISVDNPYGNIVIKSYLLSKGYKLAQRLSAADIYVKN